MLLIAERLAVLTGRDEDFLLGITDGYTGTRWSETIGLMPDYVLPAYIDGDALDIQWKLYEFGGHFYRGRPKDGSIRPADLPPFLAELLAWHKEQIKGRRCTCRKFEEAAGPGPGATWCTGGEYMFLSPGGSHYRRGPYGGRYFHPAADGLVPRARAQARPPGAHRRQRAVPRPASRSLARRHPRRRVHAADRAGSCPAGQRPQDRPVRRLLPRVPAPPRRPGDLAQEQPRTVPRFRSGTGRRHGPRVVDTCHQGPASPRTASGTASKSGWTKTT